MAIQRERLNRKNASGEYDTIHLETQADLVLMASDPSKNVEQVLGETVAIAKGGTGGTTAAAGLYNLMAGLTEMTAEELAEDDLLCVLDVDANSAKKVALSAVGICGGGTVNPELPNKDTLVLGNTVTFAGKEWIVVHVLENTEAYLALSELYGTSTWNQLQTKCSDWATANLNTAQQACLKDITADSTSGKVFVATYDQMNGGFNYFTSDNNREVEGTSYWTSTERPSTWGQSRDAYYVMARGSVGGSTSVSKTTSLGFRPYICINLKLYESGSENPEEPTINPELPDKSSLTVGNNITWANQQWIVSHVTSTEAYLTLSRTAGDSKWDNLQSTCTTFANKFTEAQKACLKSVTAGNTSGIVFVATRDQMDGGFSYFNSDRRRYTDDGYGYWTSTVHSPGYAFCVHASGEIDYRHNGSSYTDKFRPSVCIDLTLYNR